MGGAGGGKGGWVVGDGARRQPCRLSAPMRDDVRNRS